MIEITVKSNGFEVQGHAQSGEFGRDLVCAGITTLCLTLKANILQNKEALKAAPVLLTERGHFRCRVQPKCEYKSAVNLLLHSTETGFRLMESLFPEYVKITEK